MSINTSIQHYHIDPTINIYGLIDQIPKIRLDSDLQFSSIDTSHTM